MAMASAIGKPIKVDMHTHIIKRGRFARVYVDIIKIEFAFVL